MRAGRRQVLITAVFGALLVAGAPAVAQEASDAPAVVEGEAQPSAATVEDIYPTDIAAGDFVADELAVLQGQEILDYIFGHEPDPGQIVGLMNLAEATGHTLDDMTQVWSFHRSIGGDVISLAGIQIPGADTADLFEATRAWGLEMMGHPTTEELEVAGKDVTVFRTEEAYGVPNYLYASGDIAWIFSTSESFAADVLERLPD